MNRYVYSVLRFVPDPIKGEFINVGAIIGSEDTNEWQLALTGDLGRARRVDDAGVLGGVLKMADSLGRDLDRYVDQMEGLFAPDLIIDEVWLADRAAEMNNLLQATAPLPLLVDDLDTALALVSNQFLDEPRQRERAAVTRSTTYSRLEKAYRRALPDPSGHLLTRAEVRLDGQTGHFDFIIANGEAVQIAQTWSFQVGGTEALMSNVKAWTWEVHRLRHEGGEVAAAETRTVAVPSTVEVAVLYAPPTTQGGEEAFEEARVGFEEIDARLYELDAVEAVAHRAESLLEAAHG